MIGPWQSAGPSTVALVFPFLWQETRVGVQVKADTGKRDKGRSVAVSWQLGWSKGSETASCAWLVSWQRGRQAGLGWDCQVEPVQVAPPCGGLEVVSAPGSRD